MMKRTANPALEALDDGTLLNERDTYWEVSRVPMSRCALVGALEVIGDRPSLLILREMYGGVTRFDDMQKELGLSRTILADRLAKLVDAGILQKSPYREEGQRTRFEYKLRRKGVELIPAIIALAQWG